MKPYEKYIKKENVEKIHKISMDILENVGVKFEDESILEVFKEHGARIDGDIVYIDHKFLKRPCRRFPRSLRYVRERATFILVMAAKCFYRLEVMSIFRMERAYAQ